MGKKNEATACYKQLLGKAEGACGTEGERKGGRKGGREGRKGRKTIGTEGEREGRRAGGDEHYNTHV